VFPVSGTEDKLEKIESNEGKWEALCSRIDSLENLTSSFKNNKKDDEELKHVNKFFFNLLSWSPIWPFFGF
jgi:hypothetical protein